MALPSGTVCDGGRCTGNGECNFDPDFFVYSPSNFSPLNVTRAQAAAPIVINCAATFDSSGGNPRFTTACPGQGPLTALFRSQTNGPELLVLPVQGLLITDGGSLRLEGTRPVVFAVFGDAIIDGTIDARSVKNTAVFGAGATPSDAKGSFCSSRAGETGKGNSNRGGGGGGASFATAGGNGGSANPGAAGGNAGVVLTDLQLIPLLPGCPGGNGGRDSNVDTGIGGPGGGAVQISATDKVRVGGVITVSGSAGLHGRFDFTGGGGAGSGGAILLEGRTVDVLSTAIITSNGGGGGEGAAQDVVSFDGDDGAPLTAIPALGATGHDAGAGGNGGVVMNAGSPGGNSQYGGGGGGGGVGPLRINAFNKCTSSAQVLSAYLSTNGCL